MIAKVVSSIVDAAWLKDFIGSVYGLDLRSCVFFLRSQNDTYVLRDDRNRKYVARIARMVEESDIILSEVKIIRALSTLDGIKVPGILKTKNNLDHVDLICPEGKRSLIVSEFLEGRPFLWNRNNAKFYGEKLALFHRALDMLAAEDFKNIRQYDTERMIEAPLEHIRLFCVENQEYENVFSEMDGIAGMLIRRLKNISSAHDVGVIHWDHFHNCLLDENKTLILFDFDSSGLGSRMSDLAMVNWAFQFFNPSWGIKLEGHEKELFDVFIDGYNGMRSISVKDLDGQVALQTMARIYWDMGLHADLTRISSQYGGDFMNQGYFDHRLRVLKKLANQYL